MRRNYFISFLIVLVTLCLSSAWAGTWMDDFGDGRLGAWVAVDVAADIVMATKEATGMVEEKEGNLIVTDNVDLPPYASYPTLAAFNNKQNIKDFYLAVDAKIAKVIIPEYCWWDIQFRSGSDSFAGIFFSVEKGSGTYSWLSVAEVKTNFPRINFLGVVESPFIFKLDRWYHIELEMKGSQAKVWVDKELMWQADWKGLPQWLNTSGPIYLGGWGMELHLDNFVLTSDDVADVTSVRPSNKLPIAWGAIKKDEG